MIVSAALLIAGVMLRIDQPEAPEGRWLLALSRLSFLWGVLEALENRGTLFCKEIA